MDQTHIHLLITHLPIFGSILGGFVLAHGIWTNNNQTKIAAYNLLIISAIGAGIAYQTGEAAEETVENIQGVAKEMIDSHEDSALLALISFILLGVLSVGGLFLSLRKSVLAKAAALCILVVSLISFALVARTGYFGGQIRHTEINNSTSSIQNQGAEKDDNE